MLLLRQILIGAITVTSVLADFATVLTDLKALDNSTNQLTALTNAFTGTSSQAVALNNASKKLKDQLDLALKDTNNSPAPSVANARLVLNYVNDPLFVDTQKTHAATKKKKPQFYAAGLKNQLISDIKAIQSKVDALATALINKAPAQLKTDAQNARTKFTNSFTDELNYLA